MPGNSRSGRRPTPTALKVLRGNPGKRTLNLDEPTPTRRLPSPPKELAPAAQAEWRRTGRKLLALGVMTELDVAAFAAYCATYARWLAIQTELLSAPTLVKTRFGELTVNPLFRAARDTEQQFTRALVEFGMTPASRSRLAVDSESDDDAFDRFDRRRA